MSTLTSSVTSEAPPRPPSRPRALLGARVTRAGAVRSAQRRTTWALVEAQLLPSLERALWTAECTDEHATLTDGAARFESILTRCASLATVPAPAPNALHLERARSRVQAEAIARWGAPIERDARRGFASIEQTVAFAQSVIDEQPAAHRPLAARRAIALLQRSQEQLQPELRISVRAVFSLTEHARLARWRLSSEAGWCWIETEHRAVSSAVHARCALCDAPHPAHALCARCLDDRCARCARRCARCRRSACARCAPAHQCPHCGLDAIETVDDR